MALGRHRLDHHHGQALEAGTQHEDRRLAQLFVDRSVTPIRKALLYRHQFLDLLMAASLLGPVLRAHSTGQDGAATRRRPEQQVEAFWKGRPAATTILPVWSECATGRVHRVRWRPAPRGGPRGTPRGRCRSAPPPRRRQVVARSRARRTSGRWVARFMCSWATSRAAREARRLDVEHGPGGDQDAVLQHVRTGS